jgi:malate/lactate dehydrogenase
VAQPGQGVAHCRLTQAQALSGALTFRSCITASKTTSRLRSIAPSFTADGAGVIVQDAQSTCRDNNNAFESCNFKHYLPLADVARGLNPRAAVLSAGTYLDSLRFRVHLAKYFGVDAKDVEAQVIGDHGTSQVFLWSSAHIGGVPIAALLNARNDRIDALREKLEQEVRYANITIIEGHDASQHGIGIVSARIAEMILKDERSVVPIGSYQAEFGVTLSLPSVVGRNGVVEVLMPELSSEERDGLQRSARALRNALDQVAQ